MKKGLVFALLATVFVACGEKKFERKVVFPENATLEEKVEMAARVVPSAKQLNWQKLETTVFIHFGMNTFTGREWGDGKEDPALFNPEKLNTDQWAESIKNAGFKLVIITAKHHDGFCLWQTATTKHSVASSPWREGKGDVVADLRKSCEKYGLKFGVYLSPWDRNAKVYGEGKAYDDFFLSQLTELLTGYGRVDEIWFDGACGEGENGKKQVYNFEAYYELINKLMPEAVVAIMGNDVRWVGNEAGFGRETEWSATVLQNDALAENKAENERLGITALAKDLGSRSLLEKARAVVWWPSEVDVSIRPGWFYHEHEDAFVKSPEKLANIYFNSVGQNSVWLLNIPPNKDGLIAQADSVSLAEFGKFLKNMYSENMVKKNKTAFSLNASESKEFEIKEGEIFNIIEIAENIEKGQRVESFSVEALKNGVWEKISQGTTIGYKRLLCVPSQSVEAIRVNILSARGEVFIKHVKAYFAQEFVSNPTISRSKNGLVSLKGNPNAEIHYTLDGSEPTKESPFYREPFEFAGKGVVKARAFFESGAKQSEVISKTFEKAKTLWKVIGCTSFEPGYEAEKAIDGEETTMWHSPWAGADLTMPQVLMVDCGETLAAKGFAFTPRQDGNISGTPFKYAFEVSADGKKWEKPRVSGEFSNIKNNPLRQVVYFEKEYKMRYFRFSALEEVNGDKWCSAGEIDILTE